MATLSAEGHLHCYWPERNLNLFEHLRTSSERVPTATYSSRSERVKPNALIFIGGLYDTFLSVPYVSSLASAYGTWSVMEIQLSSSSIGWGICDLHLDAEEIAKAVEYVRERIRNSWPDDLLTRGRGKVVLMGHSTGSQDVLHYLYHKSERNRPPVDGAILQAPVSDREFLAMMRESDEKVQDAYEKCLAIAEKSQVDGTQSTLSTLPAELTTCLGWPRGLVSCQRFLSLTSPSSPSQPELDDLFSSDLSDKTLAETFGAVGRSGVLVAKEMPNPTLLVLISGEDECMPETIDKYTLMSRWDSALKQGGGSMAWSSGVIQGASHNVKQQKAQNDLEKRVLEYLIELCGGGDTMPANFWVIENFSPVKG